MAAPVIMRETGWDKGQFGLGFSAFLIGYALLQIPGGVIADRWGARRVLALAFCGFSLFTALTPLGQSLLAVLLMMRFQVGAFESVTFPALTSLNSLWIPRFESGRAQTLSISGITHRPDDRLPVDDLAHPEQLLADGLLRECSPGIPLGGGVALVRDGYSRFFVAAAVGAVCAAILLTVSVKPIQVETLAPLGVGTKEASPQSGV